MWKKTLKSGKTCYCERYTDPYTGKKKDVSVTFDKDTAKNRREALRILERKIETLMGPDLDNLRFGELGELYLADKKKVLKASTISRHEYAIKALEKLIGSDTLVDQLSAFYVRRQFLASGKEARTLNELLTRFKALIRWGYENDLIISISYLDKLQLFPDISRKERIANKFMESSELIKLLEHMAVPEWRMLTEFLALSGLRIGEALALEVRDVDLDAKVIRVNKTYDYRNRLTTTTKTEYSDAEVVIQPQLENVIRRIRHHMKLQALANQYRSTLFFQALDGGPLQYGAYNKYLRENTEAALGRKLSAHSLRHTHASLLFEQGFSIEEVSRRLRHGDSKVTREIYIHVTKRLKEKDAEKLRSVSLI